MTIHNCPGNGCTCRASTTAWVEVYNWTTVRNEPLGRTELDDLRDHLCDLYCHEEDDDRAAVLYDAMRLAHQALNRCPNGEAPPVTPSDVQVGSELEPSQQKAPRISAHYRPQRIKGKHALAAKMFQVIGGKRWSLVLMWDMEPAQANAEAPTHATASEVAE